MTRSGSGRDYAVVSPFGIARVIGGERGGMRKKAKDFSPVSVLYFEVVIPERSPTTLTNDCPVGMTILELA